MNGPTSSKVTVLVVDDSDIVRRRLSELLNEDPRLHVVGQAQNAAEAIRMFEALRPDALVLDYQLPDATGVEVLQHIKQAAPWCVVVMLTSLHDPVFGEICRACGADYFFHKATEFERVADALGGLASCVGKASGFAGGE